MPAVPDLDLRSLVRSGVHFGHQASRWNPKMKPYIFKKRNLIHIIDLRQTVRGLVAGGLLLEKITAKNQQILFVGTKRQAKPLVREYAEACGQPYVAERWPGGLLTNYSTVRLRLERLHELESLETSGQINRYSKKMISTLRREHRKINRNLGGVRTMERLPGALVIVDPGREDNAVREAGKLHIPTVALIDTDCDPELVDVVVPGNDDSIGGIELFLSSMADAVNRGVARRPGMMVPGRQPETDAARETAEVPAAIAPEQPAAGETSPPADAS
jgi:small subunit ribosomal protein S2